MSAQFANGVPGWMAELGLKASQWMNLSKDNIRTIQQPGHTLKAQVWATGMLHCEGYNGEEAFTMQNKIKVRLASRHIITELATVAKQYYEAAGITLPGDSPEAQLELLKEDKEHIRRTLADLEEDGVCQRTDAKRTPLCKLSEAQRQRLPSGYTRLFFWLKPRAPNPEKVRREWEERQPQPPKPTDPPKPEVAIPGVPTAPIWMILKVFQIDPPEKAISSSPDYQKTVALAWSAARRIFLEVVAGGVPDVPPPLPPQVATTGGALERKGERSRETARPSSIGVAVSSSSTLKDKEKKTENANLSHRDDDEKPKPEYASPRDEVKAIYQAKAGELPTIRFMDRLETIIHSKGKAFADYLELLRPHLGGTWKIPAAFMTHLAQTGFDAAVTAPQEKPKPKCPACWSDNQRGAVLEHGAIVACPACSTPEWRKELEAKEARRAGRAKAASGALNPPPSVSPGSIRDGKTLATGEKE